MIILERVYWLISSAVTVFIIAVIALVLLRLITNLANPNPFGWTSRTVRGLTDPLINPVRRALARFAVDPKYAPLVTILTVILFGWFALQLMGAITFTISGVVQSLARRAVAPVFGFLLHGLLSLYNLAIFVRIIFSWFGVSYANRLMRFLVNITEPLLGPLRRLIPLVGGFDISPIIALVIIQILQRAIVGTLIAG
ncbi:MAG TPA: YggT family protein [Pyrinomonadaceae bacterium]|jgi:YggT family protein|nr:YggT family protein [Pyrinomonadaceae bacterium]